MDTRKLPNWMLQAAVDDQVTVSHDGDKGNENCSMEVHATQACQPKSNTRSGKFGLRHHEESLNMSPPVIKRHIRKKRRQKAVEEGADHGSDDHRAGSRKKKNRAVRMASQNSEGRSKFTGNEGFDPQSLNEDTEELTMEDLMSIAEEYVEADREMLIEQTSKVACASEAQLPEAAASSLVEAGDSLSVHASVGRLPLHETMPSCDLAATSTEGAMVNRTGDPSQDMLNLFLGPLLKKPVNE